MFKFLDPTGATYWNNQETVYALPHPGEKWGPWMTHPHPGEPDGQACGPGGYHAMKRCDATYAPVNWWPWWVQVRRILGQDDEKVRAVEIRLRRISPRIWHRWLRLGLGGTDANLRWAYLRWADLRGADLSGADLSGAYLRGADLRGAYLRGADLSGADLSGADLREADLRRAYLRWAYLTGADLRGADLRGADLREADLREADLREADLREAIGVDSEDD